MVIFEIYIPFSCLFMWRIRQFCQVLEGFTPTSTVSLAEIFNIDRETALWLYKELREVFMLEPGYDKEAWHSLISLISARESRFSYHDFSIFCGSSSSLICVGGKVMRSRLQCIQSLGLLVLGLA